MSEQTNSVPEFGGNREDLTLFNEAISAIRTHNEQFGLSRLIAGAMIDQLEEAERAQDLVDAGATQEEAELTAAFVGSDKVPLSEEEQMARSIVGITGAPALDATGLTISPLRKANTMFGPMGEKSVGKVRLQVTDGGKFSSFLLAVNPPDINEDFQQNVSTVIYGLVQEAGDALSDDANESTALETLAYGKGIVAGLSHVGIGESLLAQRLSALTEHAQQGDVKEYILAERAHLFEEPKEQGFGPSKWQRDATNDFMSAEWGEVIDILKMAKSNPYAQDLLDILLKSVHANLDYAKGDWAKLKAEGYGGGDGYGSGFEKVFQTVELELNLLESPDEEPK